MGEKFTVYDPAEDLVSDEGIAYFVAESLKTEDAEYIAHALGIAARAKGLDHVVEETGLSMEELQRAFSMDGSLTLKTTLVVMKALGVRISAEDC
jgi:probable addiction module antidote protein